MAEKDLNALFPDALKDIYYAEKQIYKSRPKMAKAANSNQLRAAFEEHHDETEGQIGCLEQIFELTGVRQEMRRHRRHLGRRQGDHGGIRGRARARAGLLAAAQAGEHYVAIKRAGVDGVFRWDDGHPIQGCTG